MSYNTKFIFTLISLITVIFSRDIIINTDFESDIGPFWSFKKGGNTIAERSQDYALEGAYSFKSVCDGIDNYRAELGQDQEYAEVGSHRWYSAWFLIPSSGWQRPAPKWLHISQYKENFRSYPSFCLNYENGLVYAHFRYWDYDSTQYVDGSDGQHREVNLKNYGINIESNKWYRLVSHIYSNNDSTGYVEAWINGISILPEDSTFFDATGNTKYKAINHKLYGKPVHNHTAKIRFGLYRAPNSTGKQTVFFDNISIGKTASSINFYNPQKYDLFKILFE